MNIPSIIILALIITGLALAMSYTSKNNSCKYGDKNNCESCINKCTQYMEKIKKVKEGN